jgi:hypothetical protein
MVPGVEVVCRAVNAKRNAPRTELQKEYRLNRLRMLKGTGFRLYVSA